MAYRLALVLLFAAVGCHKEASQAPQEDGECFGARCVEEAEAAMYYSDFEGAREPLAAVCERGDAFQCFRLAELHHHGKGGPVDLAQAASLYEAACANDNAEGCERRSALAREGHGGPAVELEFAIKACTGGRPLACTQAGQQLDGGRGVERDEVQAIALFEKGCKLGDIDGCTGAGDLLLANPKGTVETRARGVAAYISGCVGHSGYGCLKAGIAFHEGVGIKRDVEKAAAHFKRACEWGEKDGCHVAQQLAEAEGAPVKLELTTAVAELARGGLEARDFSCRMSKQGLSALNGVLSSFARRKDALDACAKQGAAIGLSWEFADGKVQEAKIVGKTPSKVGKCVVWALRKVKLGNTGSCEAVLLLGDPEGAAKSLAARPSQQEVKKDPNVRHLRMGEGDDEE